MRAHVISIDLRLSGVNRMDVRDVLESAVIGLRTITHLPSQVQATECWQHDRYAGVGLIVVPNDIPDEAVRLAAQGGVLNSYAGIGPMDYEVAIISSLALANQDF